MMLGQSQFARFCPTRRVEQAATVTCDFAFLLKCEMNAEEKYRRKLLMERQLLATIMEFHFPA